MSREAALYQALAACGAALVTFIGVCHEAVGHILFPWGPAFLGGPIGWHATGAFTIGAGLLVLAGTLRLIRFPVVPFALIVVFAGVGLVIVTAILHREFHMFALTAGLAGAVTAFCHSRATAAQQAVPADVGWNCGVRRQVSETWKVGVNVDSREHILHLMNLYGFTIDTGDFEGFAELFAHGEWTMEGGASAKGKDQLLAGMANIRVYEDGTPKTRHTTTNIDLAIDENAGTAKSQCYVTVFQQTSEFPLQVIFSGHYFDDFERADGAWHFKKRLIRYQLVGNMSAHVKAPTKLIEKYRNAEEPTPDA